MYCWVWQIEIDGLCRKDMGGVNFIFTINQNMLQTWFWYNYVYNHSGFINLSKPRKIWWEVQVCLSGTMHRTIYIQKNTFVESCWALIYWSWYLSLNRQLYHSVLQPVLANEDDLKCLVCTTTLPSVFYTQFLYSILYTHNAPLILFMIKTQNIGSMSDQCCNAKQKLKSWPISGLIYRPLVRFLYTK